MNSFFNMLFCIINHRLFITLYNKELNEELGLNCYDFGARNYDAAIGRWKNLEALAGKWNEFSPYNYTLNNPLYFIDPDALRSAADVFHLMR